MLDPKKILGKKKVVSKSFGQKNQGSKNFEVQKNFGSKKIWDPKQFWVQKFWVK